VYDYKHGAWWIWDNIEAQVWMRDEDSFDNETIYFGDAKGHTFKMGSSFTDHGATPTVYVETHRYGYGDFTTKRLREVRVNAGNAITGSLTVDVTRNGDKNNTTSKSVAMADSNEDQWSDGTTTASELELTEPKRRERKMGFHETGEYFSVKVSNTNKYQPLKLGQLRLGTLKLGRR
jgi:hypothetical protein